MIDDRQFNGRILVIDDQEAIHTAFRTVLIAPDEHDDRLDSLEASLFGEATPPLASGLEFHLQFAHQGREGYEKVRSAIEHDTPFALAFVDMRMPPGWDGVETIKHLWEADPTLQVVMCTAYSDYTWETVVRELGKTDQLLLLKKPFANEEVYQLAAALTEKWWLNRRLQSELRELQRTNALLEREIAQRRTAEGRLRQMAESDGLTNLPNRLVLTDRLERCVMRRRRAPGGVDAVLFLDVDNFKLINDSLGHGVGDRLLIQVAERLSHSRRKCDFLSTERLGLTARLGGDEFVILLEDLRSPRDAAMVAERLIHSLQVPFTLDGRDVTIGTSIGIAVVDEHTASAEEVLRNADTAMYQAKLSGKCRFAMFDREMHAAVVGRLELENELRTAIENQQFQLHYQPIVRLSTQQITGYEALLRWSRPQGIVSPDAFISIAEETGMIVRMGYWVIEEACQQLAAWNSRLDPREQLTMSVNVSKRQLLEGCFVSEVRRILDATKTPGGRLHIEVTESAVMDDPERIVRVLQELRDLGIRIHMDDFGTGHSSLSCLHRFPIDVLKIDRSFVATMESNADYTAIIEAIITLAHNLRSAVIAEGIETPEQLTQLLKLGCDFGQGYYFAKPQSAQVLQTPAQRAFAVVPVEMPSLEMPPGMLA